MQRGFGLAQRGAVIPLVAICLAVLMGFGGMAVDIGFLEYSQQAQQAATDAAAEGGAEAAYANNCNSASLVQAAALKDASMNGYSNPTQGIGAGNSGSTATVVTVNTPPLTGPYAGVACAVSVSITTNKKTFFSRLFGLNNPAETTQAVGVGSPTANVGCLYALSTTLGQSNLSNMTIATPHCKMYLNDGANMSNSSINASTIGYTGSNNTSGTTFGSGSPSSETIVPDPCSSWSGCNWLTNNALPTTECTSMGSMTYSTSGVQIGSSSNPTCYGSLTVSSGTTATMCGLIEVTGSQLHLNGSNITACSSGVTIAMTSATSDINLSTATLNLWAPTTGNTEGVVMWRNSVQTNSVNFSGCTCNLTGMVYYPTSQVTYSSAGSAFTIMVFGQVNFSTSTLNMGSPPQPYAGQVATLGQ